MKIYLCGDLHSEIDISKLNVYKWPEQKELTSKDVLIVLGDFGLFWKMNQSREEKYWLDWLLDKPCQVAFVDGNHENFNIINNFPIVQRWGAPVHKCYINKVGKSVWHLMRGNIYNIHSKKIFVMGGALSVDKANRRPYISWWPEENPSTAEWKNADDNLNKHNNKVHYVLTHTCPQFVLDSMGFTWCSNDPVPTMLERIYQEIRFKEWHFGHLHEDFVYKDVFFCHYNNKPYVLGEK